MLEEKNRGITGKTLERFDGDFDLLLLIVTSHEAPVHASEVTCSRKKNHDVMKVIHCWYLLEQVTHLKGHPSIADASKNIVKYKLTLFSEFFFGFTFSDIDFQF